MFKYALLIFLSLFFLLCINPSKGDDVNLTTIVVPPCPVHLSIVLPKLVEPDEQENLVHGEHTYPVASYWFDGYDNRGCICQVASKPCIRKCCGPGKFVAPFDESNDGEVICVPADDEENLHLVPNETSISSGMRLERKEKPDLRDWFTVFEGAECPDNYFLVHLDHASYRDLNELHTDGRLWVRTHGFLPVGGFCMDRQAGASFGLVVFACMSEEDSISSNIFRFGALLSVPLLAVTFVVYAIIPELRNIYGKTLMCYVIALLVAYSSLSLTYFITFNQCIFVAYIVHFSFLASFFWLNVMCFDIWWTFGLQTSIVKIPNYQQGGFRSLHGSVKQRERKKFIMYSIYAWGCASIITITCIIMDQVPGIPETFIRPEFGKGSCWFFSDKARFLYFYLPMAITIICNICLFVLTALKLVKHKKDTARQLKGSDSRRHDDNKQWFNLYLKLFIVMGINWSTEIISWLFEEKLKWLWYITDLTNTLQGVIIFVIFVWKDKIKRLLLKRFGCDGGNFLSRNSNSRTGCANANSVSTRTCVTTAPLHEKSNPYSWKDSKGKSNMTFDESDGV